jgi:hypothetical protein
MRVGLFSMSSYPCLEGRIHEDLYVHFVQCRTSTKTTLPMVCIFNSQSRVTYRGRLIDLPASTCARQSYD